MIFTRWLFSFALWVNVQPSLAWAQTSPDTQRQSMQRDTEAVSEGERDPALASVSSSGDARLIHRKPNKSVMRRQLINENRAGAHISASAGPANAQRMDPFVCADEGESCKCTGSAVYGRKYVKENTMGANGQYGNGKRTTAAQILKMNHTSQGVDGSMFCTSGAIHAFGRDPAPGFVKYCYCFEGDPFAEVKRMQNATKAANKTRPIHNPYAILPEVGVHPSGDASLPSLDRKVHAMIRRDARDERTMSRDGAQAGDGASNIDPFVCADEGERCECIGTVVYTKKFVMGKPGKGARINFVQAKEVDHISHTSNPSVTCSKEAFDSDPARGFTKYCYCFLGAFEDSEPSTPPPSWMGNPWPSPSASQFPAPTKSQK